MSTSSPWRIATFGAVVAAALVLSGCGTGGTDGDTDTGAAEIVVEGAYGEVALPAQPRRIVALSAQYADMLGAIDLSPVAMTDGTSADAEAMVEALPWMRGIGVGTFDRELTTTEYKAAREKIANYEPDLILSSTFQLDERLYEQLSEVAPTFVGSKKGNNDWDDTFRAVGELTGRTAEVEKVFATLDTEFAQARERLPGLQGRTYNAAAFDGQTFFFGNSSWLRRIGLVPAENQPALAAGRNPETDVSLENIEQLDADVLLVGVWAGPDSQTILEADPRYDDLPAARNGTVLLADLKTASASNTAGPHSLEWLIENQVPKLESSALNQSGQPSS